MVVVYTQAICRYLIGTKPTNYHDCMTAVSWLCWYHLEAGLHRRFFLFSTDGLSIDGTVSFSVNSVIFRDRGMVRGGGVG